MKKTPNSEVHQAARANVGAAHRHGSSPNVRQKKMSPSITRVILYVKDMASVADFYRRHFGMRPLPSAKKNWLELAADSGGCTIALHQASVAQKSGAAVKIVFGVADVRGFKKKKEEAGLKFRVIHEVDGFEFANVKDPAGNSIQISSRGLT